MKWAMLGHIHLDRTAATWLIRRFVDPGAEFEFVEWGRDGSPPTRALLDVVKPDAIPIGIPGVELGFHDEHGLCFTKVLRKYDLRDPALWRLERIILAGVNDAHDVSHASDVTEEERTLGAALNRLGMAYGVAYADPEHLEHARSLYDAVYLWCRIQELAPEVRRRDGEGYVQRVERLREVLEDGRPTQPTMGTDPGEPSGPRDSADMPPGVHLCAEISVVQDGRERICQVRILGDDARGYLLSGLAALLADAEEEFWFETLDEAQGQAARFGIPESDWEEISDVADVRP